jgi:hypothetical protein
VAIGSGLRWIVTALALVGSASVVLVQGTKDPYNPIPPYQTYQQPLQSNTTPADVERLSILQRALLLRSVGPYRGFEGPIPRTAADANARYCLASSYPCGLLLCHCHVSRHISPRFRVACQPSICRASSGLA